MEDQPYWSSKNLDRKSRNNRIIKLRWWLLPSLNHDIPAFTPQGVNAEETEANDKKRAFLSMRAKSIMG